MNYRSVAYGYLGVLIVFAGFWYEQENYLIHTEKKEELFKMIVGTQGGYGHYMYIALIYMALFLMFVFKEVDPFLTSSVSRIGRRAAMKRCFLNMLALSSGFTFIYVLVQLVGVSVFVDMDILISKHFYQNMIFYYIAVFIIFSFGGVCYLLFYVITRLKIVSLLMAVAVNLYMVYYLKIDNLYFGLTVIDTMSLGGSVQAVIWFSKRVRDIAITTGIYMLADVVYEKEEKQMVVDVRNYTKKLKGRNVLDGVSYKFEGGNIYGLYGRNGSGKTMLMRAIAGLIFPTDGRVLIDGRILHKEISFPNDMGVIIENMELMPQYDAFDNLKILSKVRKTATDEDINEALEKVGLHDVRKKKVKTYSLGMKQKLAIAQAIFEHPKLLLLDEPTNALDEESIGNVRKLLLELKEKGVLIIIASHNKEDIELLSDVKIHMVDGCIKDEKR